MPVKIRLRRMGKKKQPFYRIVAVDSRGRRDGKYLDKIGHYNPLTDPAEIVINEEKMMLWLNRGAQPTDTVKSMLRKQGLLLKWTLMKRGLDEEQISEEMEKWEVLQLENKRRKEAEDAQKQREAEDAVEEKGDEKQDVEATEQQVAAQKAETLEDAASE